MQKDQKSKNSVNEQLLGYLSFGTQLGLMLFVAVWSGKKLDEKLGFGSSWLVWIFPLIILAATFIKLLMVTTQKKNKENKK